MTSCLQVTSFFLLSSKLLNECSAHFKSGVLCDFFHRAVLNVQPHYQCMAWAIVNIFQKVLDHIILSLCFSFNL